MSKKVIWLDCDTGHDDAYAILLAVFHAKSDLIGVSAVHGNAPLKHTFRNAKAVLKAVGRSDIKVYAGASAPLSRPPSFASDIHGESGLDGVSLLPAVDNEVPELDAASAIVEAVHGRPSNTLHLVATGPLTNVALAVQKDASIVPKLASLSIMGGAIGGGYTDAPLGTVEGEGERFGNWTPWSEFNILADCDAADFVFSIQELAAKTSMIALDLSHQVRGNEKVQRLLFGEHTKTQVQDGRRELSLTRRLFREVLMFFHGTYKTQFGILDGPPLHDPLAVYAVLEPEVFVDNGGERWHIKVDTTPGQWHKDRDPHNHVGQTVATASKDGVRVPRGVDQDAFWQEIDACLEACEDGMKSS